MRFDEAMARFRDALSLRPDFADAEMGIAMCYLIRGDFERGWPAYEARLRMAGQPPLPEHGRWQAEPLEGRRLLLVAEQGLGDTIQFLRYARVFKQLGARVGLAVQPALEPLLKSHPDIDELFLLGSGDAFAMGDFYLPLLSAPGALVTDVTTIPRDIPYLWANPDLTEHWRRELAKIGGFKIGIAWQGSRGYAGDCWRSLPLAQFAPLARLPGVRLVSLQKGYGSEQLATVDFPVVDLADRLDEAAGPFMDTAAVIRNLDLVITADTAILHLAAALGAPAWVALHHPPDWRFLLHGDDSPWYPAMRLFRQTTFGQWSDVFDRMAQAVEALRLESGSQTR